MPAEHRVQPLAGRASIPVFQQLRVVQQLGLPLVVGRHRHAALGEALVQCRHRGRVPVQLNPERRGNAGPGQVILRGAKSTGKDHHVRPAERNPRRIGEVLRIVSDDRLEGHRDAEVIQSLREIKGVCVLAKGRQHLRADCDYLSDHVSGSMLSRAATDSCVLRLRSSHRRC